MSMNVITKSEARNDEINRCKVNGSVERNYSAKSERISPMQSVSRACTSLAFSSSGLMFSGVIASLSGNSGCGGMERRIQFY